MLVVAGRFDRRLLESAADLGAGAWRRFRDIEMPLLFPGILSAGLLRLPAVAERAAAQHLPARRHRPRLPLFQWAEASSHTTMVPLIYGLSTLITLASLVLTVVALRQLFEGEAAR